MCVAYLVGSRSSEQSKKHGDPNGVENYHTTTFKDIFSRRPLQ